MSKKDLRILVTGQYWHSDFSGLLSSGNATSVTLYPAEKISKLTGEEEYDLIVIAQVRREVIDQESVDHLQAVYPNTSTVALLGSWCEGEVRSGVPWAGVPRVYWHQWEGEFNRFVSALTHDKIHDWQLPKTATPADRIATIKQESFEGEPFEGIIGVSAWTNTQYEMIADSLSAFGIQTCWIERTTWDGEAKSLINLVILDDDSISSNLENRINWIFTTLGQRPIALTLSFPRADEVEALKKLGVGAIVSKPFTLAELRHGILVASGAGEKVNVAS